MTGTRLVLPLLHAAWMAMVPSVSMAQSLDPVRYTLRFPAPHTHYLEVEAVYPTDGRAQIELMMAIWTPGSYLAREFARHVEAVVAHGADGRGLAVSKTRKNRWQVETGGAREIRVSYRVYCREMSVRTNWVDDRVAMLNGAPTYPTLADDPGRPHDVRLELPAAWSTSVTGLPPAPDGAPHSYRATDFDVLVDSPIVAGNPAVYEFEVAGRRHLLVNDDEGGVWNGPRSAEDVEKIVRAALALWGSLPYERYVFLNMITEAGGGLEHRNSTLLMTSRWRTGDCKSYLGWLGLVAHEYFHAWNVKRLRPVELGPFDYEREIYTRDLWVAEGVTSYYGDLLVHRAGLSTPEEYLEALSGEIRALQTTPGRLVQPAALASFDAWIKQYRPDENSPNSSISYYTKGAVIAFLLDARIRRATGGTRTLDAALRLAFERYAGASGFTSSEFRDTMSEIAGQDLAPWFRSALETTDELDYTDALDWLGLRFAPAADAPPRAWLGVTTRTIDGRLVVTGVRRGSPAQAAGLNVDDELVAIGEYRVLPDQIENRLGRHRPGDAISLLVSRRERLRRLDVTLGEEPGETWRLEPHPDATARQTANRDAWLRGS